MINRMKDFKLDLRKRKCYMIQLEFVTKPIELQQQIVNEYYKSLIKGRRHSFLLELDKWCEMNLGHLLTNTNQPMREFDYFEQIVKADYEKINMVQQYMKNNRIILPHKLAKYMRGTLYNSIDKKMFAQRLKVSVCPYCNRSFINTGSKGGNYQLDHFWNKSDYPVWAVSFYNLIPVCASCNYKKLKADFKHSPYDSQIKTDEIIRFTYVPKSIDFLLNEESMEIKLEYLADEFIKEDMEILEMEMLYQIHKDRVIELFKQRIIYDENYIEQIKQGYPELFEKEGDIERLITGAYIDEREYGKRPLSKFIADISKEIGLIGV